MVNKDYLYFILLEALKTNFFLDTVVSEADRNSKINLAGFGIFERKTQQARKARNPQTKKIIEVPSKKKFVFRASSKIKYK